MNQPQLILAALLLAPLAALPAADAPAKKSNILFCFADDWGRYAGAYAGVETRPSINQVVKTPNIDRMARRGVLFGNGVGVALIAAGPGITGGRVVDDFVNLMDLAPTFLEAGGVKPPDVMTGRSFMNVLRSTQTGQIDPSRTQVVTGRERHVAAAREDNLPYPHRALRTADFLYIRNFAPDRWPMGSPKFTSKADLPSLAALEKNTFAAFGDMDASPTKAWLVRQYADPAWQWYYDFAFAKRPAEELYDIKNDPDQTKNLAAEPAFAERKTELSARLMKVLTDANDPRVTGDGKTFERPPFTEPNPVGANTRNAAKDRKNAANQPKQ